MKARPSNSPTTTLWKTGQVFVTLLLAGSALGSFHTWKVNEIYSNGDGSVQFIELHESLGMNGENLLQNRAITCTSAAVTHTFIFPSNCPSATANKTLVIGTANLNSIPGGVKPDYVFTNTVPFVFVGSGSINYAGVDSVTYSGLPSNGVASLVRSGSTMVFAPVNTPVNFSGASNSIVPLGIASAARNGGSIVLSFATALGTNGTVGPNYAVRTNNVLGGGTWATATNVTGSGATQTLALPALGPRSFFRLRVP
jgi:hypothetical protein